MKTASSVATRRTPTSTPRGKQASPIGVSNWRIFLLLAGTLFFALSPLTAAEAKEASQRRPVTGLDYLKAGQRVKVEAEEIREGKLVAEEIEVVEEDDEFEVEGLIESLDREQMTFAIGLFKIRLSESTEYESAEREPRQRADLSEGVRVKVKASTQSNGTIKAEVVRIYENSADGDIELEGQIASLDFVRRELSLLEAPIIVTDDTRYLNLELLSDLPEGVDVSSLRGIRREDDEPDLAPFHLGPFYMGGRVGLAYERTRNFDLHKGREDPGDWLIPASRLEVSLPFGEHSEAYTKLEFNHGRNFSDHPESSNRGNFRVKEAFLYLGNFLHRSLALQIGRQRFRDEREWVFDDQLDAVRLHYRKPSYRLQFGVARTLFAPTGSRSDQFYMIGWGEKRFSGRRWLSGYWIKRNDYTGRDEDPVWLGIQSGGRVVDHLSYWADFSRMMGKQRGRSLRGYGFDVGANYRFQIPWEPTIAVGYAYGSGDEKPGDPVDRTFRQTRLNDNNYRYNGLKRYKYYGLLLDPELFNLKIQTVDLGFRPARRWSVNFVYHNYRQTVASDELGDIEIEARPNGRDPRLGREVDVVFAIRPIRKLDIALFTGVFLPGPAFSGERPRAFIFRPAILFHF